MSDVVPEEVKGAEEASAAEVAKSAEAAEEAKGTEESRKRKEPESSEAAEASRSGGFVRPAAAGDLTFARFWWYEDRQQNQQGPFSSQEMAAWLSAGYMPVSTLVAASYYGEVPEQMWPISELWEHPESEAFVVAEAYVSEQIVAAAAPFIEAARFTGERPDYVFKLDHYGLGYYLDEPPVPVVTAESIEAERKAKAAKMLEVNAPKTKWSVHTY